MSKEDLFDGIQIMSPSEIENSLNTETEEGTVNVGEEEETSSQASDGDFKILEPGSTDDPTGTTEEVETNSNVSTEDSDQPNAYSALIRDMIKDGTLTGPEGEELEEMLKNASSETVKKFIQMTAEKSFKAQQENWKKNLDPVKKKFLDIEDAFNETDRAIQMAQRLAFFENLSLDKVAEDEELQKNIYYEYLKEKGFTDEEAVEAIEDAISVDKLKEKTLKAIPTLKESTETYIENSKKAKAAEMEQAKKANEEAFNKLITTIEEKEEFVPGLKLNKVAKDKVKSNITTSVYQDKEGNKYTSLMYKQMRNPAEFEMLINYYDTLGLFNLDNVGKFKPDISKLKNIAKTAAVSELDQVLARENSQGVGQRNSQSVSNTTKGALDLLEKAFGEKRKK